MLKNVFEREGFMLRRSKTHESRGLSRKYRSRGPRHTKMRLF
jgi:hypothetical protein